MTAMWGKSNSRSGSFPVVVAGTDYTGERLVWKLNCQSMRATVDSQEPEHTSALRAALRDAEARKTACAVMGTRARQQPGIGQRTILYRQGSWLQGALLDSPLAWGFLFHSIATGSRGSARSTERDARRSSLPARQIRHARRGQQIPRFRQKAPKRALRLVSIHARSSLRLVCGRPHAVGFALAGLEISL